MRCRYKFKVNGRLKIGFSFPLSVSGTTYAVECNPAGVITHVCATVPAPDESQWPEAMPDPRPGVKLGLTLQSPGFALVRMEVRAIEGLLSLYGVTSIEVDNPEETWLPDSEEERRRLQVFSFARQTVEMPDAELPTVPFDLVARSILVARHAQDIEVALSFYRKGRIDIREERYLEAIYDLYFMLESVFGEGKSKNYQVKEAFERSSVLKDCIEKAVIDEVLRNELAREPRLRREFTQRYEGKSTTEIIDQIVEMRGFLHHHTMQRPGIWHPEDHKRFEIDALLLQHVCYDVAFHLLTPIVFAEGVVKEYHTAFLKANQPKPADR